MAGRVETKVQASTAAAAVSGMVMYSLGRWVFKGSVPDVVVSWVYVLVPGVLAFAAGYFAKHTPLPPSIPPPVAAPLSIAAPELRQVPPPAPVDDVPPSAV